MSSSQSPARLVILISGRGSNMQSIVQAIQNNELNATVAAVVSNKYQAPGLTFARDQGIATEVLSHRGFDTREEFDHALAELIDGYRPDYVILAGFMRILSAGFVNHYENRLLNIHPSLLPKYKGLDTHQRALDAGDEEHGASVHFVTPELDDGPVIRQARVPVEADDTADSLAARVLKEEHKLYPAAIRQLLEATQ